MHRDVLFATRRMMRRKTKMSRQNCSRKHLSNHFLFGYIPNCRALAARYYAAKCLSVYVCQPMTGYIVPKRRNISYMSRAGFSNCTSESISPSFSSFPDPLLPFLSFSPFFSPHRREAAATKPARGSGGAL